jgi:hypothetical protein
LLKRKKRVEELGCRKYGRRVAAEKRTLEEALATLDEYDEELTGILKHP